MKKRTKIILITASILVAAIAVFAVIGIIQSNEYYSHPVYNTYESGDETFVKIDSIEYKMFCYLDSNLIGDMIGFLDDKSTPIYSIKGDTDKNFLYVKVSGEMPGYWGYYRSDFVLPEASAVNINKMTWWDSTSRSTKIITDKSLINDLFKELDIEENIINTDDIDSECAQIDLYFKDTPGLLYEILVWVRKDGSFYCSYSEDGKYKEIKVSKELLERIAGHKLT